MVADVLREFWAEPAPGPSERSRLDGALVLVLIVAGIADGLASDAVAWPTIAIPVAVTMAVAVYWRRTATLAVTLAVFGGYIALHGAMLILGVTGTFLNAGVIVVLVYTLARWASGRDAIIGLAVAAIGTVVAGSTQVIRDPTGAIALPTFVGLFVLAGLAVRLWTSREAARLSEATMAERNRIARELHDTVARANPLANMIVAGVYIVTIAAACVGEQWLYFLIGSAVEVVILALIIRTAKRWPVESAAPSA